MNPERMIEHHGVRHPPFLKVESKPLVIQANNERIVQSLPYWYAVEQRVRECLLDLT